MFDRSHLVASYASFFNNALISIPTEADQILGRPMLAPPEYRQAGSRPRSARNLPDRKKRQRRFRSRGEQLSTHHASSVNVMEPAACATGSTAVEADLGSDLLEFFNGEVSAATKRTRRSYQCRICHCTGHNASRCPSRRGDNACEDIDIMPGNYVVGESPYLACCLPEID